MENIRQVSETEYTEINRGGQGAIYRYSEDKVLKVYFNGSYNSVWALMRKGTAMRDAGLPVVAPDEIVKCGDRFGVICDYVNEASLGRHIMQEHDCFDYYLNMYINGFRDIHSRSGKCEGFVDVREEFLSRYESIEARHLIPENEMKLIFRFVEAIPQCGGWVHNDPHPRNFLPINGKATMVDIDAFGFGHPVFDIAQIYAYMVALQRGTNLLEWVGVDLETGARIWKRFVRDYLNLTDETKIKECEKLLGIYAAVFNLSYYAMGDFGTDDAILACMERVRKTAMPEIEKYTGVLPGDN